MRVRWMLPVAVLVLAGIIGNAVGASADSADAVSELHRTWFVAGYLFDVADDSDGFLLLRLFLRDVASSEIKDQIAACEQGDLSKGELRLALIDYLRTVEGLASLEAFCMGEWVSNVEDSVIDIKRGAESNDERLVFEGMADAYALANQANHFIDVFAGIVSPEVLRALEGIADKGSKIDMAGLISGDVNLEITLSAIVDLIDDCRSIKSYYELGS